MSLRKVILGSACAIALAGFVAGPASATDFNGLLGADYSHLDANGGGGSANSYGVSGSGMFGIGSQFAGQVDGSYHHVDFSGGGGNTNDWTIAGTGFWTGAMGRVGAVVGYDSVDGSGTDAHVTNYGAYGDWYASHAFTVGLKGGGFSGSGSIKGDYVGAAVTGYATQDFAITGGYDYAHLDHLGNENDWSIRAEWLVSERTPVSVYAGYTNSKISGGGPTINVFSIGLTYYCDPVGPESLVAHQRTGAEQWGNSFGPTLLKF